MNAIPTLTVQEKLQIPWGKEQGGEKKPHTNSTSRHLAKIMKNCSAWYIQENVFTFKTASKTAFQVTPPLPNQKAKTLLLSC